MWFCIVSVIWACEYDLPLWLSNFGLWFGCVLLALWLCDLALWLCDPALWCYDNETAHLKVDCSVSEKYKDDY